MLDLNTLKTVAQQMKTGAKRVFVGGRSVPVTATPAKHLKKVEFFDHGRKIVALEQNPNTGSRWAQAARQGKNVVQFKDDTGYVAVSVNGNVKRYNR